MAELVTRYEENPVLTAADWPSPVNAVFNPAAVRHDGETLLLVRVEDRTGISHLGLARSADGLSGWRIEPEWALLADTGSELERHGIEDPRITRVGDEYLVTYTAYSSGGPLVCLAATRDFRAYERRGAILAPENKDAALFPEPIGGQFAILHRPVASSAPPGIWIGRSPDLTHWGDHEPVLPAGAKGAWDSSKVGLGPPPLPTAEGWLLLYHGVRETAAGAIYRCGLALLDRDHPERVLSRSASWVLAPEAAYERIGDVGNVVFPCGWTLLEDGDTLHLYYGAADSCVCVATASLGALLAHLRSATPSR
jgi:predicted GH43/DUF377 family glycosyl hydrolase